jgi:hypothetical protein
MTQMKQITQRLKITSAAEERWRDQCWRPNRFARRALQANEGGQMRIDRWSGDTENQRLLVASVSDGEVACWSHRSRYGDVIAASSMPLHTMRIDPSSYQSNPRNLRNLRILPYLRNLSRVP